MMQGMGDSRSTAGRYDLICEQGATFELPLKWFASADELASLAEWVGARMKVKRLNGDQIASLTSEEDGGIVLTDPGRIDITISAEDTSELPPGNFRYDLEIEHETGLVRRLLQGWFTVDAEVTD